ncbi:putative DNA binding domain-containing protein [Schaalia sp. 19OD2882]|uniref:RNA-binding domain-containing protein n=1 Tax=Schaalia sp. 19OD2882 TaxID=2794089 RepID=UPI001C1EF8C5|nr:RNA-binding domain-containing protein [Schaalia sp. 19OD2882]QWW19691.1 putative DNA binding domain-containing protein [Schaalia sp. 19OD2882]
MITSLDDLQVALARLELEHGDCLDLEAKTFSEYSTKAIAPSLCSLANLPGGGTILLGVGERPDGPVVGVDLAHDMAKRVTNLARNGFSTELQVDPHVLHLGDKSVVAVNVHELPVSQKPCMWQGKAYIRQYDGDYTMSLQEQQQFLSRRERPRDDRTPVPGTSPIADLDPEAVTVFAASVRQSTPALADATDDQILHRLNVVASSGEVTVAGLYALGVYPQQHLPHLALTAAVEPNIDAGPEARATNRKDFTGALPDILRRSVEWVAQNLASTLVVTKDGRTDTDFAIPLVAVREVIANALVHRDLSDAAAGRVVELRLTSKGMVLTSPGGLWGLSVDQLGTRDGKSAVNEFLYEICRHAGGPEGRVIEAMGTGIVTTKRVLREAGLEAPRFVDNGVRFTVFFPNHALHSHDDLAWIGSIDAAGLNSSQREALLRMRAGAQVTNADYRTFAQVDSAQARSDLRELVRRGLVDRVGERRGTRYVLARPGQNG